MPDIPNHKDQQDEFSRLVKEKLENHQIPVDESIWKGIEQKMAPSPGRFAVPVWYWIPGAAVAAVALILLLNPFSDTKHVPALTGMQHTGMKNPDSAHQQVNNGRTGREIRIDSVWLAYEPKDEITGITDKKIRKQTVKESPNQSFIARVVDAVNPHTSDLTQTDTRQTPPAADQKTTENKMTAATKQHNDAAPDKKAAEVAPVTSLPDLNDYPVINPEKPKIRKKQPLLIAASFGSGGSLPELKKEQPMGDLYAGNPNLVKREIASTYSTVLNANDFSEARHDPPLSAGIALTKPLNAVFSLESGLVYTYLRSEYYRPGLTNNKGVLHLHYLGVPLNLITRLTDQPRWNLYLSTGGMLEKGLRSVYVQEIEDNQATINTNVKSGIDGVQWSLNGALGVSYKLQNKLSLFAEPEITYYLQNNQPRSARTEHPVTVGLNGGLRIEL